VDGDLDEGGDPAADLAELDRGRGRVPLDLVSVAPQFVPLPVTAFPASVDHRAAAAGPQVLGAVIEIPEELRRAPSPSGVFKIPTDLPPKK